MRNESPYGLTDRQNRIVDVILTEREDRAIRLGGNEQEFTVNRRAEIRARNPRRGNPARMSEEHFRFLVYQERHSITGGLFRTAEGRREVWTVDDVRAAYDLVHESETDDLKQWRFGLQEKAIEQGRAWAESTICCEQLEPGFPTRDHSTLATKRACSLCGPALNWIENPANRCRINPLIIHGRATGGGQQCAKCRAARQLRAPQSVSRKPRHPKRTRSEHRTAPTTIIIPMSNRDDGALFDLAEVGDLLATT
ncbi:MAG: hypothetical protein QM809_16165 [Gordonia sp. (in: high G+C Gram-positive bacteria)]|uniref:hypothetical protein n=1 Tax=Gordonia sp. (in: high G+C Gram-positive bacteria) TaxID=84139 RepID=UPI0039E57306